MSLDISGAHHPQPLMSASLEDRLVGWFGRAGGFNLLAAVALVWISLVSWSLTDPSLTHATSGRVSNWLGPLGAITSDLMLQTLGFSAALALLAPMFWGMELIRAERVDNVRLKAGCYPLGVLLLAGALSSLPTADGWPLHNGFGGILGDAVFNLTRNVLSMINAERGGLAGGLLLFFSGFSALMSSLGLKPGDLRLVFARTAPHATADATFKRGWFGRRSAIAADPNGQGLAPQYGLTTPPVGPQPHWDDFADEDPFAGVSPALQNPYAPHAARPSGPPHWQPAATFAGVPPMAPSPSAHRGGGFDVTTEEASRMMAERFAPAGAHGHAPVAAPAPARSKTGFLGSFANRRKEQPQYRRPSLNLLKRPAATRASPEFAQTVLRGNARLLEDVLGDFGVKGEIKDIRPGPVVTLYELEPARGTKSSRVVGLADDIARSMSATSVRCAVVPGRNAIGIELPNVKRETVLLREILESELFRSSDAILPMALGKSIGGDPIVADLARMPHLLVAGTTGSGKSVGVNAMILSLLYRHAPEDCRFLMIDPKMLELSIYNGIPHLLTPVVTDPQKAVAALNWAVAEMEERYKRMAKLSVRNIDVFNNRVRNAKKRGEMLSRTVQTGFDAKTGQALYETETMAFEPLPYIVVVVDEFADLMIVAGKEIEAAVQRLAQMARAAGIHLIMATQRPSVDIVTGTIKANFPTRISFKVASKIDSRTILNDQGAEQLLGQGDMLYCTGGAQIARVHGPFVADEEVESLAQFLREQGEPQYVDGITDGPAVSDSGYGGEGSGMGGEEDLYARAVATVLRDRKASTSYLQRRLSIGYNRAADLIERMEREGLITPANAVGKREILAGGPSSPDMV